MARPRQDTPTPQQTTASTIRGGRVKRSPRALRWALPGAPIPRGRATTQGGAPPPGRVSSPRGGGGAVCLRFRSFSGLGGGTPHCDILFRGGSDFGLATLPAFVGSSLFRFFSCLSCARCTMDVRTSLVLLWLGSPYRMGEPRSIHTVQLRWTPPTAGMGAMHRVSTLSLVSGAGDLHRNTLLVTGGLRFPKDPDPPSPRTHFRT